MDSYDYDGGAQATEDQTPSGGDSEQKPGEERTALINSDICEGMKVGDEMVVKIVGIHDNEYEVAYAPEPKDQEAAPEDGSPEAMGEEVPASGGDSGGLYD